MPTTSQVTDEYVIRTRMDDQASAAIEAATKTVEAFEAAAQKAAEGIKTVGAATEQTGTRITAATSSFDRYAKRYDDVSQAQARLTQAQKQLQAAQEASSRALASGATDQEAVNRTLAEMASRVDAAARALGEARAEAEASAAAQAAWNGVLGQGTEAWGAYIERTTAGAQASRAAQNAAQQAAAAQAEFNRILGVQQTGEADYAKRAQDIQAYGASLDALRAKIDPLFAASKQYEGVLNDIDEALKTGAIPNEQIANNLRAQATKRFEELTVAAKSHAGVMNTSTLAVYDGVKAFSELAAGMPVTMVAMQHLGQATYLFGNQLSGVISNVKGFVTSAAGIAAIGTGAAVVALGVMAVAAEKTDRAIAQLSAHLQATRSDYAAMAQEVEGAARGASGPGTGISYTDAFSAGSTLAASSYFKGTQQDLQALIKLTDDYAAAMGMKVPDAAKKMADMMNGPAAAAEQLMAQHVRGFTADLVEHVKELEAAGDKATAFALDQKTLQGAIGGAAEQVLTPYQQALKNVADAFAGAHDNGQKFAHTIGDDVMAAVTGAINGVAALFTELNSLDTKLHSFAEQRQQQGKLPGPSSLVQDPAATYLIQWLDHLLGRTPVVPSAAAPEGYVTGAAATHAPDVMPLLQKAAQANGGLDPAFLAALQGAEGVYRNGQWITSPTGAVGLMQVTPTTFHGMQAQPGVFPTVQGTNLYTDQGNANAGAALIAHLLQKYGNVEDAVLAYHDGEAAVDKWIASGRSQASAPSKDAIAEMTKVTLGYSGTGWANGSSSGVGMAATPVSVGGMDPTKFNDILANASKGGGAFVNTAKQVEAAMRADHDAMVALTAAGQGNSDQFKILSADYNSLGAKLYTLKSPQDALTQSLDEQIAANENMAAAYAKGGAAVVQAQAHQQAYHEVLNQGGHALADNAAYVDALTQKYVKLTQSQLDEQTAQQTARNNDQVQYLQAETDSLGMNNDARTVMLAHLQAEQKLREANIPLTSEQAQAYLKSVDAMTQMNLAYQHQKQAMDDLANMATSAFNTIGNAITQAFVQGQGAAVNWGNITRSVVEQVIQKFLELAVLNPIENTLFGQGKTTLGDVAGLLGGGGGGGGGLAVILGLGGADGGGTGGGDPWGNLTGGGGGSGGGGLMGDIGQIGNALSTARSGYSLLTNGITLPYWMDNAATSLLPSIFGAGGTAATTAATSTAVASGVPEAALDDFVTASTASQGGAAAATTSLSGVASALGGVGLGFGAGTMLNSLLGGKQLGGEVGSGVGAAAGAVIGSFVPVVGTILGGLIGGLIGGAGGGLIGGHKKNPYSNFSIVANDNGLYQVGPDVSQLLDDSQQQAQAAVDLLSLNQYLIASGLRAGKSPYTINIGKGVTGLGQVADVKQGFMALQFSDPGNSALNDALSNPMAHFSSLQDLQSFVQWFTTTMPNLLQGMGNSQGTLNDSLTQINQTYNTAIATAQRYGVATDQLSDAWQKATDKAWHDAQQQTSWTEQGIINSGLAADGNPADARQAQWQNFDVQAEQQKVQLDKQLTDLYGQSYRNTADYNRIMSELTDTLGKQRDQLIEQLQQQNANNIRQAQWTEQGIVAQGLAADGNPADALRAQLMQADIQAQQQKVQLDQQLVAAFGDSYRTTADYTRIMGELNQTLANQKQQIEQSQWNQAMGSVTGTLSGLTNYVQSLELGGNSPLSPVAQYDLSESDFDAISKAALGGDYKSLTELQGAASGFLAQSRNIWGSGTNYVSDFNKVVSVLQQAANMNTDPLTASALNSTIETQTQQLSDAIDKMRQEIVKLRVQVQQNSYVPPRIVPTGVLPTTASAA